MKILNLNSSILCIQKCMYDIKNIYLCQEKVLPCCGIVKKKCAHQCSFLRIQFYQNSTVGKNLQFFLHTTGTTVNLLTVSKPTLCWRNQLFYFWILAKLEQLGPADTLFLLCPYYIWFILGFIYRLYILVLLKFFFWGMSFFHLSLGIHGWDWWDIAIHIQWIIPKNQVYS